METEFKIVGLNRMAENRPDTIYATCEPLKKEYTFHAEIQGSAEEKQALWIYCKNHWNDTKIAVVKHDGFKNDGFTPVKPVVMYIKEVS